LKRVVSKNRGNTAVNLTAELSIYREDRFHKNIPTRASPIQHPQ